MRVKEGQTTIAEYAYDALGRRVLKDDGETVTRFIYDGQNVVEEYEYDDGPDTWDLVGQYVHGPGIDNVLTIERGFGGTVERWYYLHDGLGSVTELLDDDGALSQAYEYDAWGIPTIYNPDDTTIKNPYLYTNRRWDPEINLYYYRARYYAPQHGRFTQPDPLRYADGPNAYEYVGSLPTRRADPDGTITQEQVAAVAEQMGMYLPFDHSKDTSIIKAIQKTLGVVQDGLFGASTILAYQAWAQDQGLEAVEVYAGAKGRYVRRWMHNNARVVGDECLDDWNECHTKYSWTLYYIFFWESLDTNVPSKYFRSGELVGGVRWRGAAWNTIGGPFGTKKGRQTAVGLTQITEATGVDIVRWKNRHGERVADDWWRMARYSEDDSIGMGMTLFYMIYTRDCDAEKAFSRWEAYTGSKGSIQRSVKARMQLGHEFQMETEPDDTGMDNPVVPSAAFVADM